MTQWQAVWEETNILEYIILIPLQNINLFVQRATLCWNTMHFNPTYFSLCGCLVARWRHRHARHACEQMFWRRISLFDSTETEINRRYRLPGQTILTILDDLKEDIEPAAQRCHAIPGIVKRLLTLEVIASVSLQTPIVGDSGLSQPSISRVMWDVVPAIACRVLRYIRFPQNRREIEGIEQEFFNVAVHVFPQCCGRYWLYTHPSSTTMGQRKCF